MATWTWVPSLSPSCNFMLDICGGATLPWGHALPGRAGPQLLPTSSGSLILPEVEESIQDPG